MEHKKDSTAAAFISHGHQDKRTAARRALRRHKGRQNRRDNSQLSSISDIPAICTGIATRLVDAQKHGYKRRTSRRRGNIRKGISDVPTTVFHGTGRGSSPSSRGHPSTRLAAIPDVVNARDVWSHHVYGDHRGQLKRSRPACYDDSERHGGNVHTSLRRRQIASQVVDRQRVTTIYMQVVACVLHVKDLRTSSLSSSSSTSRDEDGGGRFSVDGGTSQTPPAPLPTREPVKNSVGNDGTRLSSS